jgi:hypothetical protein
MQLNNINIDSQSLDRVNKGTTFLNLQEREERKKFYVRVSLKAEIDLREKKEEVLIETNLPIERTGHYRYEYRVGEFFEDLKIFVEHPLAKIRIPLKSEITSWTLDSLKGNLREETIKFSDIDIQVGDLAKKKMKKDFKAEVERILNLQDNTSHKEIQDRVNAYMNLRTKIEALQNLLCKERDSYCYSSREKKKDDTIKLPLTAEEYNSKLQEIEKELRVLEKEFGLRETDLNYEKVKDEHTFDNWLKENEEQLREDFENNQEEDSDSEMTFDEYAEMVFEQGED